MADKMAGRFVSDKGLSPLYGGEVSTRGRDKVGCPTVPGTSCLPDLRPPNHPTTRWCTTLSSKVNLHHAIDFRALRGANLVTEPSKFEASKPSKETLALYIRAREASLASSTLELAV